MSPRSAASSSTSSIQSDTIPRFFASLLAFLSSMIRTSAASSRAREMMALSPSPLTPGFPRDGMSSTCCGSRISSHCGAWAAHSRTGSGVCGSAISRSMTTRAVIDPLEDAGQDVVAADEHQIMQRPHVADRDHRGLAFLKNSRPASNSSTSRSWPISRRFRSCSASWKLKSSASSS